VPRPGKKAATLMQLKKKLFDCSPQNRYLLGIQKYLQPDGPYN